jgi:hypothetical protein
MSHRVSSYKYVIAKLNFFGCIRGDVPNCFHMSRNSATETPPSSPQSRVSPSQPNSSMLQALVIAVSLKRSSKTCHYHRYYLPLRISLRSGTLAHLVLRQAKGGSPPDVPVSTPDRRISLKIATSEKGARSFLPPACAQYNPPPRPHTNSLSPLNLQTHHITISQPISTTFLNFFYFSTTTFPTTFLIFITNSFST